MTQPTARTSLLIERRFDVPPETVFATLTVPDEMRIWWGEDAEIYIDLRVGGKWTIIRQEDGVKYLATGEYLGVERPTGLLYTFGMPQFSPASDLITIRIEADDGGSLLRFEHSGSDIAAELRDLPPGETSPSEAGWQLGFDLMVEAWADQKER
ncbi:MAG: SRPBCC domain-containing protein [Planctomycetes bacterium]|nr:SRPBCC domain-containing protein [Planctomycetota bacterium]